MKPNHSTYMLLRGLLLPSDSARDHLDRWSRRTDLDSVDSATHQLLPLLYRRLIDLDLSPPEMERLRGVYKKTWYRNQRHLAALTHAGKVLRESRIEATLVGDMAVALRAYSELGSRTIAAAQIMVPPESSAQGLDRLIKAGFAVDGQLRPACLGLPTRLTDRTGGQIDIQSFVYGPGWPGALDQGLWGRRIPMQFDGPPLQTLDPVDAIASVAAFGLASPFRRYQCLVDLALLSRQTDPAIAWADLIEHYGQTLLVAPICENLRNLGDAVPGALSPEASALVNSLYPTRSQRLHFWFHRRDRRFARLPAWYRRATRTLGDDEHVGFMAFAKSVYGVRSAREALVKARRRLPRARGA